MATYCVKCGYLGDNPCRCKDSPRALRAARAGEDGSSPVTGSGALQWSEEKPKRAGWWWWLSPEDGIWMAMVEPFDDSENPPRVSLSQPGNLSWSCRVSGLDGLWAGPLESPDAPLEATLPNIERRQRNATRS